MTVVPTAPCPPKLGTRCPGISCPSYFAQYFLFLDRDAQSAEHHSLTGRSRFISTLVQ